MKPESMTWHELYSNYKKYSDRLIEIERYFRILPEKRKLSPTEQPTYHAYEYRLWDDVGVINRKLQRLDEEIDRRKELIGASA